MFIIPFFCPQKNNCFWHELKRHIQKPVFCLLFLSLIQVCLQLFPHYWTVKSTRCCSLPFRKALAPTDLLMDTLTRKSTHKHNETADWKHLPPKQWVEVFHWLVLFLHLRWLKTNLWTQFRLARYSLFNCRLHREQTSMWFTATEINVCQLKRGTEKEIPEQIEEDNELKKNRSVFSVFLPLSRSSSSSNIQDQCLTITDIYVVPIYAFWHPWGH